MSKKLRTIIVDDEPVAIKGIRNLANEMPYLDVVGSFGNAMEALEFMNHNEVDLMFLDINMPKITGLELLRILKKKPITIITSAYREYALESFDLDVLDYLVKPISLERFTKACLKAKDFFEFSEYRVPSNNANYIFVNCDKKIEKVFFDDILFIESLNNYISIVTEREKLVTHLTLKSIEEILPKDRFLKVQKSFIVSLSKVKGIVDGEIVINEKIIPISRDKKKEILKIILGSNYLKG